MIVLIVAFHISLYTFILHYVTIHAFHNIQYMYHFTHDYKYRLHIHMHASVLHIIYSTHTHGYNIIMHRHTYVGHIIAHTLHSVHNTHRYSSQFDCGLACTYNIQRRLKLLPW